MEKVVEKDIAVKEVQKFVEKFKDVRIKDFEIEDEYEHLVTAVEDGYLSFKEDSKPVYRLKYPLKDDQEQDVLTEISQFKTRIRPYELDEIMSGLDVKKKPVEFALRIMSFFTMQAKALINKMEKCDYRVIEQLSTVFQ